MNTEREIAPLSPAEKTRYRVQEILDGKGKVLVVDPYAVAPRIQDGAILPDGSQSHAGESRGSFYTNMSLGPIANLAATGNIERIVIFSDASLGSDHDSAGDIVIKALVEGGPGRPAVDPEKIKIKYFQAQDMASTANQVKALSEFLEEEKIAHEDVVYYASWNYHGERLENHLRGWKIKASVMYYEFVKQFFNPKFNLDTLNKVLPHEGIRKMEAGFPFYRRQLSRIDTKGRVPMLFQRYVGGAHTLDNARSPEGLEFVYMPGKKRLAQVEEVQRLRQIHPNIPSYIIDYAVRSTDDLKGKFIKGRAEEYLYKVEANLGELKSRFSGLGISHEILVRVAGWHINDAQEEMDRLISRVAKLGTEFPDINPDYILHSLVFYPWEDPSEHLEKVRRNRAQRESINSAKEPVSSRM